MSIPEGRTEIFCPVCRSAWESGRLPSAEQCLLWDQPIAGLASVAKYRPGVTHGVPERLIYHIKHHDNDRVFRYTAENLACSARTLIKRLNIGEAEMLVSYPPRKKSAVHKDGFDQAKRLAKYLSRITGWPMLTLLARTEQKTKEQKTLKADEREKNARAAYELAYHLPDLQNRTVLLVDDLYTTGATLRACADLLLEAGAKRVVFATVARTE